VFATPALGGQPYGVAISPRGAVLVAQVSGGLVTRFDLPDTVPDASVTSGLQPVHVAVNPGGTRAFVINQAGQAVRVIDLGTSTTVDSVRLTNDGFNLAVAPNGQRVYVTTGDGRVYVISTASNSIVDSMRVGTAANGLAFSPGGDRLYVSSRDAGTVTVFNTQTNAPLDTIRTSGMPQRLAISTDGARLFVANELVGVNVVNLPAGTLGPNIPLDGSAYGLRLSPDGTQLYATNPRSGKIFIVDAATNHLLSTLIVGGVPRNVAFDVEGTTAVVTDGAGRVIFIH
jgi:YVTN family beta-propeller protein